MRAGWLSICHLPRNTWGSDGHSGVSFYPSIAGDGGAFRIRLDWPLDSNAMRKRERRGGIPDG